jgi:glyoxylase-like metal-dependent hydrolase (beta-lactamase superfamily II)
MFLYIFPLGPLETNAILIGCGKTRKAAVIDPAFQATEVILDAAQEHGLTIEKILLTHSHWDHFADAFTLKTKTQVPLYVHPLDAKNLSHPGSDGIPLYFTIHPVAHDHVLEEGDTLCVGELSFRVIHTPGHSPGGICLYAEGERLLISGDTLFQGSMGTLSLPTASPHDMWASLKKLSLLPHETRVIPGHGGATTIGDEALWLTKAEEIFKKQR